MENNLNTILAFVIGIVVAILFLGVYGTSQSGCPMMGGIGGFGGYGGMAFGWIIGIGLLVALVFFVVWLVQGSDSCSENHKNHREHKR